MVTLIAILLSDRSKIAIFCYLSSV